MEVILLQDVVHLGKQNDLVKVRPGYGRNLLLPKGLAALATESQRKQLEERLKQDARREEKIMSQLQLIVDTLKSTVFQVVAKSGTSGKIFGSVTNVQLADAIKKQKNINIDRKKITLAEDVKNLGSYTANVNLHKDVEVSISFEVVEG
jgi:large subunit ribosomal protein L9